MEIARDKNRLKKRREERVDNGRRSGKPFAPFFALFGGGGGNEGGEKEKNSVEKFKI